MNKLRRNRTSWLGGPPSYRRLRLAASTPILSLTGHACSLCAGDAPRMTPSEWSLRFVPRRAPPLWQAALITLGAFAAAIALRVALVGGGLGATGLSASYFPAFILATLYAII